MIAFDAVSALELKGVNNAANGCSENWWNRSWREDLPARDRFQGNGLGATLPQK